MAPFTIQMDLSGTINGYLVVLVSIINIKLFVKMGQNIDSDAATITNIGST